LGIVVIAVAVLAGIGWLFPGKKPDPPTQDSYDRCINERIDACVADAINRDLQKSRLDLPEMPPREEYIIQCRAVIARTERLYPDARCEPPR
jgi:hypothetical protein